MRFSPAPALLLLLVAAAHLLAGCGSNCPGPCACVACEGFEVQHADATDTGAQPETGGPCCGSGCSDMQLAMCDHFDVHNNDASESGAEVGPGDAGPADAGADVMVCLATHGDCDGDPTNGCETPLDTPLDCGSCGHHCVAPTSQCVNGQCVQ